MGAVDRSIQAVCRGPPTGGAARGTRSDFRRAPPRRYHHRFASMRTNPQMRGGSAVPAPTADPAPSDRSHATDPTHTTSTPDQVLAREQAHLDHARAEL